MEKEFKNFEILLFISSLFFRERERKKERKRERDHKLLVGSVFADAFD